MALTILTEKGVNGDWGSFLDDEAIKCPITFEEAKKAEAEAKATEAGFVATPAHFFGLKFSSAVNADRFDFNSDLNGVFPDPDNKDIIMLGLDENASWKGTVDQMLTAFTGRDTVAGSGVVAQVMTAIAKHVEVSLVNEAKTRNGIWCVAGQTRVISTALVFSLDPATALDNIKEMLKDKLAIEIDQLKPLKFYLQRTFYGTKRLDRNDKAIWSITDSWAMTIQATINSFDIWLEQDSGKTSVTLNPNDKEGIWAKLSRLWKQESPATMTLTAQATDPTDDAGTVVQNQPPSKSEGQPSGPDIPLDITLLSISLGTNQTETRWWQIKTVFQWEVGDAKPDIMIGLSYSSVEKTFLGELLTKNSFESKTRLMTYRESADAARKILNIDADQLPDEFLLSDIFPEAGNLPAAIPNAISAAQITYSSPNNTESIFGLQATLVRKPKPGTNPSDVPCPFTWDSISINAERSTTQAEGSSDKKSTFSFGASSTFTLHPREEDIKKYSLSPATLAISVDYDDGDWQVEGHVQDLNFGALVGLMDPSNGVGDAALNMLAKLSLTELNVLFTYKDQEPSSFLATGIITFGALELRLFYQYVGSKAEEGKTAADVPGKRKEGDPAALKPPKKGDPAAWKLRAYLGAADGKKTTVGEIIDSIVGEGEGEGSDVIPEFIKGIEISPSSTGGAVSFEVTKDNQGAAVFVLNVDVEGIKFSYMQISGGKPPPAADGSLPSADATAKKPETTRILRIAVGTLPSIGNIPLVSELGQPFDKMLYLYVSGDKGLLQHELDTINQAVTTDDDKLVFKRAVAKPSLKNPVINKGHHFIVIQGGDVVIDHVFEIGDDEKDTTTPPLDNKDKIPDTGKPPTPPSIPPRPVDKPDKTTKTAKSGPANTPTKGSLTKTMGPLTISALTLEYKSQTLFIHMDATLTMGPISLGLLGFGIGFLTTGLKLNDLSKLVTEADKRLSISLRGISLAFDRPPVLIAGMFEHEIVTLADKSTAESYRGGIGIGFPPYTFIGVGEYSDVKKFNADRTSAGGYKSIFLFAKLDGPLVTLEFATISGVRLGFGFNSIVRSPRIDELTEFPFIKSSSADGAAKNPMAILKSMTPGWVTPREGSYWLAAGMTVTSFDIIAITAVAMFAFRDSGVVISIFADAVAQLPPHVPDPAGVILYVEIGMVAEMNLVDGYFRVEASLAPSSYLLVPQCHLTGGFALAYWFGNNPNAGDWVFSIGGYHRAFTPPPYYPVPARLAISFVIGDNIQMRGESYFAITPKAAMAGALIHISLSVGPVSAYLDASFDALINFHPFHYIVEFSVSIGVECNIDIWFIHIHISIHIGAELHIEGPEFGGIAHVDFWFFGFDIEFGARIGRPPPLELLEFWNTTHQPGPGTSDREDTDANPVQSQLIYDDNFIATLPFKLLTPSIVPNTAFKFILEDGNFPMPSAPPTPTSISNSVPSTGAGAKWFVKGGTFRFGVTTEFAISSIKIVGTTDSPKDPLNPALNPFGDKPDGKITTEEVYSNPMHVEEAITSALTITIRRVVPAGQPEEIISSWLDIKENTKKVPVAMWNKYDPDLDVMARGPRAAPPASLLDGSSNPTVPQTLGVNLSAPFPVISPAKIPKFKASAMARLGVENLIFVGKRILIDEDTQQPVIDEKTKQPKLVDDIRGFDWFIPDFEPVQSRFMGSKLTDDEKKMDAIGQWNRLAGQWKVAAEDGKDVVGNDEEEGGDDPDGLLGLVSGVFGWGEAGNRPVGEVVEAGKRKPWMLSGRMPKNLVTGLKDFYLDLPRFCV